MERSEGDVFNVGIGGDEVVDFAVEEATPENNICSHRDDMRHRVAITYTRLGENHSFGVV